jgi:hypothetical protein
MLFFCSLTSMFLYFCIFYVKVPDPEPDLDVFKSRIRTFSKVSSGSGRFQKSHPDPVKNRPDLQNKGINSALYSIAQS